MPRAIDARSVSTDRLPSKTAGGPIPDFGWKKYLDGDVDPVQAFIENLLQQIKDATGIDLFWLLDWSWTTNTLLDLVRQSNDLFSWLQNPLQRPPNLLSRPGFSSPSAIVEAPDWSWDPVVSLGTFTGPGGVPVTDPQGSARTIADGLRHALMSNAIADKAALTPGQILTCQIHVLVEAGFIAANDQAIRLELVPSRFGVLQESVVLAHCGVPTDDPGDWVAAPVGSKAVFFDVDYTVPEDDSPDTIELRLVVDESASGNVAVRFDGGRVAAAGGFLVVLSDLFDAGRIYLTALWDSVTAWLEDVFDPAAWTALKTDTDEAWAVFVRQVKRALHHADADLFHPPNTSDIIETVLRSNPWFGWLTNLFDDWLQPVLKIGKVATEFGDSLWHAITVFANEPSASGAWSTLMDAITAAWNAMVNAVLAAWDSDTDPDNFIDPVTAATEALRNNDWFGWLFDMVDTWLEPVLKIGKAVADFGEVVWHAITVFANEPTAPGAWSTMVSAIETAWDVFIRAVFVSWGSTEEQANAKAEAMKSPADATKAALKNNPVTGWLWGNTFEGGGWLNSGIHAITDPIENFFDQVRRYINQMIQPLHWGYFDANWTWVPSLTTLDSELPGSGPVMTPGRNDGDNDGISWRTDSRIPAAPTGLVAFPWVDLTNPNFPAGNVTYAIAAMKGTIEGPAALVTTLIGTITPPSSMSHVSLSWTGPPDATGYRIYRKVDAMYSGGAVDWRLVASPATDRPWPLGVDDKTIRGGGTVEHPKTDAELAAQIVTGISSSIVTQALPNITAPAKPTAAQVQSAVSSLRSYMVGGYDVTAFATNVGNWTVPAAPAGKQIAEMIIVCCGAGQAGEGGDTYRAGKGGLHGGVSITELTRPFPTVLSVAVGTNGNATTVSWSGGSAISAPAGSNGGRFTQLGYDGWGPKPGNGGDGGPFTTAGAPGANGYWGYRSTDSGGGAGGPGAGGTGKGGAGGPGGAAALDGLPRCGGGGSGGASGGSSAFSSGAGGSGGSGGVPGGGGGGGGAGARGGSGNVTDGGAGGRGGDGAAWVLIKTVVA